MYLTRASDNVIVARNDDFNGLDPEILFTPPATDTFRLIVTSFSNPLDGWTDVRHAVGAGAPVALATGRKFGGNHYFTDWNRGIRYDTRASSGDPVLLLRDGTFGGATRLYFDDDGAGFPNSRITPTVSVHGGLIQSGAVVILGSFSEFTQGDTSICQFFRSWISSNTVTVGPTPLLEPFPTGFRMRSGSEDSGTSEMARYLEEYQQAKPRLGELSPNERDQEILGMQRRLLSESEIRTQSARPTQPTPRVLQAQQGFLQEYRTMEQELDRMDYEQRVAFLSRLKAETVERAQAEDAAELAELVGAAPEDETELADLLESSPEGEA